MHSVLIIEPHPLTRQGLAVTIENEPDLSVCAQAATREVALEAMREFEPDAVVMALHLTGSCGLTFTRELVDLQPGLGIVAVSEHGKPLCAERALRAGARGFITGTDRAEEVIMALRAVLRGEYYICPSVNNAILRAVAEHGEPVIASPIDVLSDREMELFTLMGQGFGTRDIAERMGVSVKTVESYRTRAKAKLQVDDTSELVCHAVAWASQTRVCLMWDGASANGQ